MSNQVTQLHNETAGTHKEAPAHARCMRCASAGIPKHPLGLSIRHYETGAYSVEPVWVCEYCRPDHERCVAMTTIFRKP